MEPHLSPLLLSWDAKVQPRQRPMVSLGSEFKWGAPREDSHRVYDWWRQFLQPPEMLRNGIFQQKHINAAGFLPSILPQIYMGWWLLGFPGPIWASLLYQNLGQDLYLGWSGWKSDHIGHVKVEKFSIFQKTDTNQLSNIYGLNGFKPFFLVQSISNLS